MNIKQRNPIAVIIFSIITLGIYAIYWTVKTKEEIKILGAQIPTAWLMIIPIANIYFWYKYAEGFSVYAKKDNSTILWFLLFMVIAPVGMILVQMELNKLATSTPAPQVTA